MRKISRPLLLLFVLPFFHSCLNNANFDQINLDIEPIINAPLVSFELNQLDFLDDTGTTEIQTRTDITDLDILQSSTVQEDLLRADFDFEIRNTFDRQFTILVELLNANDDVVYTFASIQVNPNVDFLAYTETIIINDSPQFLQAETARVTINLSASSTTLDPAVEDRLEFKSTGTFYFDI